MDPHRHVLYFALRPPWGVARAAGGLLSSVSGLTRVAPERLHVSLTPLGRFPRAPEGLVEAARRAAGGIGVSAFRLEFNRLAAWGRGDGARPIVLSGDEGVIGAEALHEAIHARLAVVGLTKGAPRPIWPHMTLARGRGERPEAVVAPLGWRVSEFVLIHSHFGRGRHDVLGRWTLDGGSPIFPATGDSHGRNALRHQELRHDEEGLDLARQSRRVL